MLRKILIGVIITMAILSLFACKKETKEEIKNEKFEFNLSIDELRKRTSDEYIITKKLLDVDAKEYMDLSEGDKQALKHLVKASTFLEKIEYQIDNIHNLDVLNWLNEKEKEGNEQAKLTKILFIAQQGVNAIDRLSNEVKLIKNIDTMPGMGVYPEDLKVGEFHNILFKMLNENKIEELKKMLNQRSVVVRDGDELKAIDYVDFFKEDFKKAADELLEASKVSTDKDFNEFLQLQAEALVTADSMLDAKADIKWATLQDTPLEFTITRENYDDAMTSSISENNELYTMLQERGINIIPKDRLGCRVGIVNKEGSEFLTVIKKFMPELAKNMPYSDEYEQSFSDTSDIKQTMVDVDLIVLNGDAGDYRGGITLAENLPNDDKLSLTMGGGRRNVYHRQIRFVANPQEYKDKIDAILDKEQHKYYNIEADHWFTIGHENCHSLGPQVTGGGLGKYRNIIEENKADMGSLSSLDILTNSGMYNEEQKKQIIVTNLVNFFIKAKPEISQAHRVRQVMQINYLHNKGAFDITSDGKIHVNIDKAISAARLMLEEIIRLQIDQNFDNAEKFVNDNFVWTDYMEMIGQKLQKVDKKLNGKVEAKLMESLLNY